MKQTNYNYVNSQVNQGYEPKTIDGFINLYKELHDHLSIEICGNFKNYFYVVAYHHGFDRIIMAKEFWTLDDLTDNISVFEQMAEDAYKMKVSFESEPLINRDYRQQIKDKGTAEYRKQYYRDTIQPTDEMAYYKENQKAIKQWIDAQKEASV